MTDLIYLKDSYRKTLKTKILKAERKGDVLLVVPKDCIFYPQGGGQPSDTGRIKGKSSEARVLHARMSGGNVVLECSLTGTLNAGDAVECTVNWDRRFRNMRRHTAGHVIHEAVMSVTAGLTPLRADHGDNPFIEYAGSITRDKTDPIEVKANEIVARDLPVTAEFVSFDQLSEKAAFIPPHLPNNKPLRIVTIEGYRPVPDGGTQVSSTGEVGPIRITGIENRDDKVRVEYAINEESKTDTTQEEGGISAQEIISLLLEVQSSAFSLIDSHERSADDLRIRLLGSKSPLTGLTRKIRSIPKSDASRVGIVANEVKKSIEQKLSGYIRPELLNREAAASPDLPDSDTDRGYFDPTEPGSSPPVGHLHIVSQAITEITDIFARIGFSRVRHPEVDWDWYAFESLNMPLSHPARDEWETFFIDYPGTRPPEKGKFTRIVLTPHTSNGQVREMEKGELPIRMINIAKCYRRQSDVSHTPMFHQFEGLYVDRGVSIAHLKGVIMYFARSFYGSDREIRLRPFHFQFTEPSFEIDVSCGICHGKGVLPGGSVCRLCKSGWLELGGAGMVHPNVLKAAGIDPKIYNGFAFGWGVERTYMMKSGTKIDDLRILYGNDIRFLEQF